MPERMKPEDARQREAEAAEKLKAAETASAKRTERAKGRLAKIETEESEKIARARAEYEAVVTELKEVGDPIKHPDLWLEASADYQADVKKRIEQALEKGDYARAEKYTQELAEHVYWLKEFEQEHSPLRAVSAPDALDPDVIAAQRAELLELLTEKDWETIKEHALNSAEHGGPCAHCLVTLKRIDPTRFDQEIKISDALWEKLTREFGYSPPIYQMAQAAELKSLDPARFDSTLEHKAGYLKHEAQRMAGTMHPGLPLPYFVQFMTGIKAVDPVYFNDTIAGDKKYRNTWDRALREIERVEQTHYFDNREKTSTVVSLRARLNEIRPADEPSFTITPENWDKIKEDIGRLKKRIRTDRYAIDHLAALVADAMTLKVERKG